MKKLEDIKNAVRDIVDFPKEGIIFKDITPILSDRELFKATINIFASEIEQYKVEYIAGIESRGFIFASALALKLNIGFVPIRKPGKLPHKTYSESYQLEYGSDSLEIHQDALPKGSAVVLIDDLLATGGTALAASKLLEKCGADIKIIQFLIELTFLNGISKLSSYNCSTLIKY